MSDINLTLRIERKMDAAKRHGEIKREFPEYADKARALIISYLKENDPNRLEIYLGNKNEETLPHLDYSIERFRFAMAQKEFCLLLKKLDDEKVKNPDGEQISPHKMDWYMRRWLGLSFKIIENEI